MEEEKVLENVEEVKKEEIKRPWQSKVLIILCVLFLINKIGSSLFSANLKGAFIWSYYEVYGYSKIIVFFLILFFNLILGLFIIIGLVKRYKLAIYLTLFLSGYLFLNVLRLFLLVVLDKSYWYESDFKLIIFIYLAFALFYATVFYFGLFCLKHSFYNQKQEKIKIFDFLNS